MRATRLTVAVTARRKSVHLLGEDYNRTPRGRPKFQRSLPLFSGLRYSPQRIFGGVPDQRPFTQAFVKEFT